MSGRINHLLIKGAYQLLYNDGYVSSGSGPLDMPAFDGVVPGDDDGKNLKNGKKYYIKASNGCVLNTVDGIALFAINGLNSYTLPFDATFSITYLDGYWYFTFFDVTASTPPSPTVPGNPVNSVQWNNAGAFDGFTGSDLSGGVFKIDDGRFLIRNQVDSTKRFQVLCSNYTTGVVATIDGTLTANRIFSLPNMTGTFITSPSALTATRIPYYTATGLQDNANMVWDNTNTQLGLLASGTAALPTIGIGGTDIGIYESVANELGFTTSATLRFRLDATSFRSNTTGGGIVRSAAGAVGTPTFSFAGDTNTGLWNSSADTIAFVASGANQFFINDSAGFFGAVSGSAYVKAAAGTAALPTYSFVGDTDTGFWSNAANTIKISVLGGQTETINTTGHFFGSSTAPTARVHIAAGSTSVNSAPIKLTSGTVMTTPETGAIEFTTDDLFFTITTGGARKNITLWDTLGTSGRVPFATTNGRLTDSANLAYTSGTGLFVSDNIKLQAAGNGFYVKEGTNATMGVATLVAGTVTVNTTKVTATSRIFLTHQNNSGTLGFVTVSARTAATSFTITSSNVLDTSDIAWIIMEPA